MHNIILIYVHLSVVSLVSDELQELRRMRDATKLHVAQVLNIKPGVRKYPSMHLIILVTIMLYGTFCMYTCVGKNTQTVYKWCEEFSAQECG